MPEDGTCVILNPASGRRRTLRRLRRIRDFWGDKAQIFETERAGHAERLAEAAALSGPGR